MRRVRGDRPLRLGGRGGCVRVGNPRNPGGTGPPATLTGDAAVESLHRHRGYQPIHWDCSRPALSFTPGWAIPRPRMRREGNPSLRPKLVPP